MAGRLFLGTSGYVYRDWRGLLYPEGLPASRWLDRYAGVFDTVELNGTFYRLPSEESVRRWRRTVPKGFLFAVKGSRFLTHMKRLIDAGRGLSNFHGRVRELNEKLGPVLWQLPPNFKRPDLERLDRFLGAQPRGTRHVLEFRDAAWYVPEVCDVLDRHGAAFCEHDLVDRPPPRTTGGWRYLRFHGAGAPYAGRYGKRRLRPFARDLRRWLEEGRKAFVYFNNDVGGAALYDARDLGELLGRRVSLELPPWRAG